MRGTPQLQRDLISTLKRTLQTALLFDAFWERWIVHGISEEDIRNVRQNTSSIDEWIQNWNTLALEKKKSAALLHSQNRMTEAEMMYRSVSLHYNLNYWIFPSREEEKQKWYEECLKTSRLADTLSPIRTEYDTIRINGGLCAGRIRIPDQVKGCIIIVNPIDSSKEELYTYEWDFIRAGYATISFDGPGQGETYTLQGLKGDKKSWEAFINATIEYALQRFRPVPIYLFGTSLGASWALFGSTHPAVEKTVAVSPAVDFDHLRMPEYFLKRMDYANTLIPSERAMPSFTDLQFKSPVLLFHGQKDLMVPTSDIDRLYGMLEPDNRTKIEYENEGHCCNHKLYDIRRIAIQWFNGEVVNF